MTKARDFFRAFFLVPQPRKNASDCTEQKNASVMLTKKLPTHGSEALAVENSLARTRLSRKFPAKPQKTGHFRVRVRF
jgi:hypothetical protein